MTIARHDVRTEHEDEPHNSAGCHLTLLLTKLAEKEGFEPSAPISGSARFPSESLQPLGHLSVNGCAFQRRTGILLQTADLGLMLFV